MKAPIGADKYILGHVLRLHRMFLEADDRIIRALARYLVRSDRRASASLDEFIDANHYVAQMMEG